MYRFGSRSEKNISTCHKDLRIIFETHIQVSPIDYGVHEGGRTVEKQQEYFDTGVSKINPKSYPDILQLAKRANHIIIEDHEYYKWSRAGDIHISEKHQGKSLAWDEMHLGVVIGGLIAIANKLYYEGKITHKLRSGGDWDGDGVFKYDQNFQDLPHVEIYKP